MNPNKIQTFEKALYIGKQILDDIKHQIQEDPSSPFWTVGLPEPLGIEPFPKQNIEKWPWEMSEVALTNTLQYVMNYLHHPCYLFCHSIFGKRTLYKLETKKTSNIVKEILQNVPSMNQSSENKKKELLNEIETQNKNYRIMQCIVKPFTDNFSDEYKEWVSTWKLSPGVYLLNLTDAMLLRKDGRQPFPNGFIGKENPRVSVPLSPMLPILSTSGHVDYWDIVIPNYDDLSFVFPIPSIHDHGQLMKNSLEFHTKWSQKQDLAIFRGSPSGCGVTAETNPRLKLMEWAKVHNISAFDVGFTSGQKINMKLDPRYGFALSTPISKNDLVSRKSMIEQSHYKYIIHIDGNVLAYRLLYSFLTGSLIWRVKSPYQSFVDVARILIPGKDYLEIAEDLSNLEETWEWCRNNSKDAARIARNGMLKVKKILHEDFIQSYIQNLFQLYVNHQTTLQVKKKAVPRKKLVGVVGGKYKTKKKSNHFIRRTRSTRNKRLSS